jgi:hypothetical protein
MESKIFLTIAISSILAFALITTIPTSFENVFAQGEGPGGTTTSGNTGITDGMTNGGNATGGMSEGQTDPNGEGEVDLGTGGP